LISSQYTFKDAYINIYDEDGKVVSNLVNQIWENNLGVKYELQALLDAGTIKLKNASFMIPLNTIYDSYFSLLKGIDEDESSLVMSPELMKYFDIPKIGNGTLEIESKGSFRSKHFRIVNNYRFKNGTQPIENITTNPIVIDSSKKVFILSKEQNEVCHILSEFELTGPYDQEENFRIGGKVRRLSELGDIEITGGRIKKENIEDVETIRPRFISSTDGGIDIGFDIESGNNAEFENLVNSTPEFQDIYSIHGKGTERKRYILGEEAKKAVNSYRRKSHFTRDEKHLLLDQPKDFLDGFNLDDYSERVVGYGVLYAPKMSAFQGENGTEWVNIDLLPLLPETDDEQDEISNKTKSLKINKDNVAEIKALIDAAEAAGESTINFNDQEILINDELKKIIKKKIELEPGVGLITKSNIDEITHQEGVDTLIIPPNNLSLSVPINFSNQYSLKPYQEYGYAWLKWVHDNKFSGCLLADDMGMGKTIQIAAKLAFLKDLKLLKPSLLIVPPILLTEWHKELSKFVSSISIYPVRGRLNDSEIDKLKTYDIISISYQSHLKNQRVLGKIPFKIIVCDEVQFIKNPASARAQAVLAMNGEFKIAATGTPIENSISELWSILDYSNPGYLPPLKEFNKSYGDRSVSNETFKENVKQLKNKLTPIVLRRTKDEYLKDELPEKQLLTHFCDIDDQQVLLCRKITDDYKEKKSISNFLHFFQMIIMALTNPELLDGAYGIVFTTDYVSPKQAKTIELLNDIYIKNEKVLLFADRKRVQWNLKEAIENEYQIKVNVINGETPQSVRTRYTSPFRPDGEQIDEFSVLILSPKCAGFGLNLVQANNVIHYLRSFNPAVENQATDRVYRIGQKKPVYVHNIVSSTKDADLIFTVEQKLDEMIKRKQSLLRDYLYASRANRISERELAIELGYDNPGLSMNDIDKLNPEEFEILSALIYSNQGYNTSLTPQHDFGADCIALGRGDAPNVLIQCKKKGIRSKSRVGNSAVQEIVAAQKEYERQKQISFEKLVVITNGYFTDAAKIQANSNGVILIDRNGLFDVIDKNPITMSDFYEKKKERYEIL